MKACRVVLISFNGIPCIDLRDTQLINTHESKRTHTGNTECIKKAHEDTRKCTACQQAVNHWCPSSSVTVHTTYTADRVKHQRRHPVSVP